MNKKYNYYVYKTEHKETKEYYFGRCKCQTDDPSTDRYFGSGKWVKSVEDKSLLSKVIIAEFDNIEDASALELKLISEFITDDLCMNLRKVSGSGSNGTTHTEEAKTKISAAQIGKTGELCHNTGLKRSTETRQKQSAARKGENNPMHGKTHTEESKVKMSDAKLDTTHSEETKAKISAAKTGKTHTDKTKAKQSAAQCGEKSHNAKLTDVKVILIRELYATGDYKQKELAEKFGVKIPAIYKIIHRKTWKNVK